MTQIETAPALDEIRNRVRDFVVANFLFGTGDPEGSASLLDEGIIDSMGVLEIVSFLEDELGVVLAHDEVVPEIFESIDSIAAFVWNRR